MRCTQSALVVLLAACLTSIATAATIQIPADQPSIQAGISASANGDTVLVHPGTYIENINFDGHNVVLGSLFLTTGDTSYVSSTVIHGDLLTSAVTFASGEDSSAVITGFTIQNGRNGIRCSHSSPVIRHNIIRNNQTLGAGGGISCSYSSALIENNRICGNSANIGGGIRTHYSSAIVRNNAIIGNSVHPTGGYLDSKGGGISCYMSDLTIINNVIADNRAHGYIPIFGLGHGGGIHAHFSSPAIINNTIVGNAADAIGGGIYCHGSSPTATNNILWANTHLQMYCDTSSSPVVAYCNVLGGWTGEGNINVNPLLVDPDNENYNICTQSPCIDAGDPGMQDPDGSRADIGVFYEDHPQCSMGRLWHVSTAGDDISGDGSAEHPFRTIQHAVDVSFHRDTVLVANGGYSGPGNRDIDFGGRNIVLSSEHGPDFTVLDCGGVHEDPHRGFYFHNGEDSTSLIEGFTIQGGYGDFQGRYGHSAGGGIYCENSSPVFAGCVVTDNDGREGGGMYCSGTSSPVFRDCSFADNTAGDGGGGGAKFCSGSSGKLVGCRFAGNIDSAMYSNGGGLLCENSSVNLTSCLFVGNIAPRGGGLFCSGAEAVLTNCTIVKNSADMGSCIVNYGSSMTVNNCIMAFNTGAEPVYCTDSNSIPELTCCDIHGNTAGDWTGCIAAQARADGNMGLDPVFCDTAGGDWHLSGYSPCARGNNSCGSLIGALAVGCGFYVCGDADGNGEVTLSDVEFLRDFYFNYGAPPLPLGAGDPNGDGFVGFADILYLADYLHRNGTPPQCP